MEPAIIIILVLILIAVITYRSNNKKQKVHPVTQTSSKPTRKLYSKETLITSYHSKIGYNSGMQIIRTQSFEIKGAFIENRKDACLDTMKGEELKIVPEPNNQHDKNALVIRNFNNKTLGYIPASSSGRISRLLKSGTVFRAFYDGSVGPKYFRARVNVSEYKKHKPS